MAVAIHPLKIPFKVPIAPGRSLDRFVNIYVVVAEEVAIIDSGVKGSEKAIYDKVRSLGRKPNEISKLILTHSHPDHIGAAPEIVNATGCRVFAHAAERNWIEKPAVQKNERPVPGFDTLVSGPVRIGHTVADGDEIAVGDSKLTVLHTPGHSKGSISILSKENHILVTGDAVPVVGDVPIYDDAFGTIRSLKRLRDLGPMDYMLSAWDAPKEDMAVQKALNDATLLVQTVHRSVVRHSQGNEVTKELLAAVLRDIGLPPTQANPLFARTVLSHLRYKNNVTQ